MNTVEAVEAAQTQEVFDVLSFIEETAYPTATVVVYRDVAAAHEYVKAVDERANYDKEPAGTKDLEITSLTERIAQLGDKIKSSSLVFELQGMPPGMVRDILKAPEGEEGDEGEVARDNELIAKTIQNVKNGHGARDPRVWTAEDVVKLRSYLNEGEFGKLLTGVSEVNFNAAIFQAATDAGFSGGSSDLAA